MNTPQNSAVSEIPLPIGLDATASGSIGTNAAWGHTHTQGNEMVNTLGTNLNILRMTQSTVSLCGFIKTDIITSPVQAASLISRDNHLSPTTSQIKWLEHHESPMVERTHLLHHIEANTPNWKLFCKL